MIGSQLELSWQVDPARYSASGFCLWFKDVDYFEVTLRDSEMPVGEDSCLDSVAKIEVSDDTNEFKAQGIIGGVADDAEDFHLYFRFHEGQTVRIGSRTAKFVKTS